MSTIQAGMWPVIFIDDDRMFRDSIADVSRSYNVNAFVTVDVQEAVLLITEWPHAIVVSDLKMDGTGYDGVMALREIKSAAPQAQVCILSGYNLSQDDLAALEELGALIYDKRTQTIELMIQLSKGRLGPLPAYEPEFQGGESVEEFKSELLAAAEQAKKNLPKAPAEDPDEAEPPNVTEKWEATRLLQMHQMLEQAQSLNRDTYQALEQARIINREFSRLLLQDLASIPKPDEAFIYGDERFSVSDLIDDIMQFTPRGVEYLRLWNKVMIEMYGARSEPPEGFFKRLFRKLKRLF